MSFFEDSFVKGKPALFIRKTKDDKNTKVMTLITNSPVIGSFSKKCKSYTRPPKLPKWSQTTLTTPPFRQQPFFLIWVTSVSFIGTRHNCQANWRSFFNMNWEISYNPYYRKWLKDVLSRCKPLLIASQLYNVVFASLFTYDYDDNRSHKGILWVLESKSKYPSYPCGGDFDHTMGLMCIFSVDFLV